MRRLALIWLLSAALGTPIVLLTTPTAQATPNAAITSGTRVVSLTFDASVPGTIQDHTCSGTGFTYRLPGTGGSRPACDPLLDLSANAGRLTVTSTHFDINSGGVSLDIAQTWV